MKNILKLCMLLMAGFVFGPKEPEPEPEPGCMQIRFECAKTGTISQPFALDMNASVEQLLKQYLNMSPSSRIDQQLIDQRSYYFTIQGQNLHGPEWVELRHNNKITYIQQSYEEYIQRHVIPITTEHVLLWIQMPTFFTDLDPYSIGIIIPKDSLKVGEFRNSFYADKTGCVFGWLPMLNALRTPEPNELFFFLRDGIVKINMPDCGNKLSIFNYSFDPIIQGLIEKLNYLNTFHYPDFNFAPKIYANLGEVRKEFSSPISYEVVD